MDLATQLRIASHRPYYGDHFDGGFGTQIFDPVDHEDNLIKCNIFLAHLVGKPLVRFLRIVTGLNGSICDYVNIWMFRFMFKQLYWCCKYVYVRYFNKNLSFHLYTFITKNVCHKLLLAINTLQFKFVSCEEPHASVAVWRTSITGNTCIICFLLWVKHGVVILAWLHLSQVSQQINYTLCLPGLFWDKAIQLKKYK